MEQNVKNYKEKRKRYVNLKTTFFQIIILYKYNITYTKRAKETTTTTTKICSTHTYF